MNLPILYEDCTKEEYKKYDKEIMDFGLGRKSLMFIGDVGVGKTWYSYRTAYFASEYIRKLRGGILEYEPCIFYTSAELSVLIRDCSNYKADKNYNNLVKELKDSEYLIIDDIGIEQTNSVFLEVLTIIIDHRYKNSLPVCLSTNLNLEQFKERYGERLMSRIMESYNILEMEGGDQRAKKVEEEAS